MIAYILMVVLVYPSNTATSFSQEFSSKDTCEHAAQLIKAKSERANYAIVVCTPK